jgi:hypothetical protein
VLENVLLENTWVDRALSCPLANVDVVTQHDLPVPVPVDVVEDEIEMPLPSLEVAFPVKPFDQDEQSSPGLGPFLECKVQLPAIYYRRAG